MIVYDQAAAAAAAQGLRRVADSIERREVKYVALLTVLTLDGVRDHGHVLQQLTSFIESVGPGEYLLVLGALRDFYLNAESLLLDRGAQVISDLTDEIDKTST